MDNKKILSSLNVLFVKGGISREGVLTNAILSLTPEISYILQKASLCSDVSENGIVPLLSSATIKDNLVNIQWNKQTDNNLTKHFIVNLLGQNTQVLVDAIWFNWNSNRLLTLEDIASYHSVLRPGDTLKDYINPICEQLAEIMSTSITVKDKRSGKGGKITGFNISIGNMPDWLLNQDIVTAPWPTASIRKEVYLKFSTFVKNGLSVNSALSVILENEAKRRADPECLEWLMHLNKCCKNENLFAFDENLRDNMQDNFEKLLGFFSQAFNDLSMLDDMIGITKLNPEIFNSKQTSAQAQIYGWLMIIGRMLENGVSVQSMLTLLLNKFNPDCYTYVQLKKMLEKINMGESVCDSFCWAFYSVLTQEIEQDIKAYSNFDISWMRKYGINCLQSLQNELTVSKANKDFQTKIHAMVEEKFNELLKSNKLS